MFSVERCRFSGMKIVYGLVRLCWILCWKKSNTCQNNLNILLWLSKWNFQFFISNWFCAQNSAFIKKKSSKLMCATLTGFSVQWQLLFLSLFPTPPPVDFSELPSTKNICDIHRSMSDYSTFKIFPSHCVTSTAIPHFLNIDFQNFQNCQ